MALNHRIKKTIFYALVVGIGIIAMQVPFTKLLGANVKFTLFDFYGPVIGGLLGSVGGLLSVLGIQLANWGLHGFATDTGTLLRFVPTLAAVLYFSRRSRLTLVIPTICILAFIVHPEGRVAWYYTAYWLIPFAGYALYNKFLFARALGATFTAHAVGGALWIWAFNLKASVWIGLIPVVFKERLLMAIGISLSYLLLNRLLRFISKHTAIELPGVIHKNPAYASNNT